MYGKYEELQRQECGLFRLVFENDNLQNDEMMMEERNWRWMRSRRWPNPSRRQGLMEGGCPEISYFWISSDRILTKRKVLMGSWEKIKRDLNILQLWLNQNMLRPYEIVRGCSARFPFQMQLVESNFTTYTFFCLKVSPLWCITGGSFNCLQDRILTTCQCSDGQRIDSCYHGRCLKEWPWWKWSFKE